MVDSENGLVLKCLICRRLDQQTKLLKLLYQAHTQNWEVFVEFKLLYKLKTPEYQEILDNLAQLFVKDQTFREILSLVYQPLNIIYF